MQTVYLIIGVPGAGKTWVCDQLGPNYNVVRHDDHMKGGYLSAIMRATAGSKPVVAEAPFSVSQTLGPLEAAGIKVVPLYILERNSTLIARYEAREGRSIPQGHLTRMVTYAQRAEESGVFRGTSEDVLEYLQKILL